MEKTLVWKLGLDWLRLKWHETPLKTWLQDSKHEEVLNSCLNGYGYRDVVLLWNSLLLSNLLQGESREPNFFFILFLCKTEAHEVICLSQA